MKPPAKDYKEGDKGRMVFFYPCWIDSITEDYVVIKDQKGHLKTMDKWLFEKHWEADND